MSLNSYTTVAASNIALFPEGMAPSAVNDSARQMQADLRQWYVDAEWADRGDAPTYVSASSFTISGDVTSNYVVNRRIKCNATATVYGVITASSYSAPNTTVTVGLDSGNLTSSLSSIALSIISPTNLSIPSTIGFKGATIASASTTDLSTATGDFVDISGTTTITAFGTVAAGVARTVRFTGALTLTHNSTSLILPGAANITTANGDTAIFRSLGSGNWQCITYSFASGSRIDSLPIVVNSTDSTKKLRFDASGITTATTRVWTIKDTDVSNAVVQRVSTQTGAVATGTTSIPVDDTIPQNTEGDQYMSLSITPKNTANKLRIDIVASLSTNVSGTASVSAALFQDSTANALASQVWNSPSAGSVVAVSFTHTMSAGTTSATTFKLRAGTDSAGTTTFNGASGARLHGGVIASSITITEYAA